eukprot:2038758-Amphidinium_carterae.1
MATHVADIKNTHVWETVKPKLQKWFDMTDMCIALVTAAVAEGAEATHAYPLALPSCDSMALEE